MGLVCRELPPPPASAQLPVLGKRLWLLQSRGGHAGHCQAELHLLEGRYVRPWAFNLGVGKLARDSPRSG